MSGVAVRDPAPVPRRRWLRLADRLIRTKVMLLVAVPVAAVVALTAYTAVTSFSAAAQTEVARQLVDVGTAGAPLTEQLQRERAAAAMVFALGSASEALEAYRRQNELTDKSHTVYRASQGGLDTSAGPAFPLRRLNEQLAALPLLREQVRSGSDATESLVVFRYGALISGLLRFQQSLSQADVDPDTANRLRAIATLSRSIEALGQLQVTVVPAITADSLTPVAQQQVIAADAAFTDGRESFRQLAPSEWWLLVTSQPGGQQILAGERMHGVVVRTDAWTRLDLGVRPAVWVSAMNARMQQLHRVEDQFFVSELRTVTDDRDRQRRNLTFLVVVVVAGLALAVAVGTGVSASITRPLRALQAGATHMATDRLPAVVAELSTAGRGGPEAAAELVKRFARPLGVAGADEIGAVTTAFNLVGETAVRLAAEEAAARGVVSDIVTNVARRLHGGAAALMGGIDLLERSEEDPDRLAKIFRVDHLANQSRRTIANLLVIAGQRVGSPTGESMPLQSVISAAAGRLENYDQVEALVDVGIMIDRDAVEELVHLLTELFANGLEFAKPGSRVEVEARQVGNTLRIEITDYGIGIPAEEIPRLLERTREFRLDGRTVRQMGLVVVGRIAERHGIRVEIYPGQEVGTVVHLLLPSSLFGVEKPQWAEPVDSVASPAAITGTVVEAVPAAPVAGPAWLADATYELPMVGSGNGSGPSSRLAVTAAAPTLIFDEVVGGNPWFCSTGAPHEPLPVLNPAWSDRVAASPTASAGQLGHGIPAPRAATTPNGLPKRVPGVPPQVAPPPVADITGPRDPKAAGRKLSSFAAATRSSRGLQ